MLRVRRISIITAAYAPTADYLVGTARSIEALEVPAGWELEWIVQEDGESPPSRQGAPTVRIL